MKKRIFCIVLAVIMVACMIPFGTIAVFAEPSAVSASALQSYGVYPKGTVINDLGSNGIISVIEYDTTYTNVEGNTLPDTYDYYIFMQAVQGANFKKFYYFYGMYKLKVNFLAQGQAHAAKPSIIANLAPYVDYNDTRYLVGAGDAGTSSYFSFYDLAGWQVLSVSWGGQERTADEDGKYRLVGYGPGMTVDIVGVPPSHTFSEEWTYDETGHWHVCTLEGCYIEDYSTCGVSEAAYGVHDFTKGNYVEYDEVNHKWAKKCDCGAYDETNALTGVDAPTAATGLFYNGETQTGVSASTGFTLTGNTGKDVKTYTAVATLESGYIWSDGTTEPKAIEWTITASPTVITGEITAADFGYEMVIPTATTLTEANHENVLLGTDGKVSITNIKHPTDKVNVSYTVDLSNGNLTDGTNTINATYKYKQGDAEFAAIDGTTKVTVYANKTVTDSLVNVTANNDQWNAAPAGTYNATVTFNFETEEKETTCKVTDLIMYRVVKIEDGQDGRVIQLMYLYRDGQFTAPSESCFDSSKTGFESAVGTSDYAVGDCFHMNADYSGYTKCVNPDSHGINSDNVIISISRSDIQEGTKLYFAEPVGITYAVKDGALYFPADKESSWTEKYTWTLNGVPLSNGDTGTLQDGDAFIGTKISN